MRFGTLDGLRGVAAILVLFFHFGDNAPMAAKAGYLAVDLFFCLSGFVLSHAYESQLRNGLSLREFAVLRFIRVYPMAAIGTALGVFFSQNYVLSLLLVPDFGGNGTLYPANVPLWSLALELLVNVVFSAVAIRVRWRGLALILLCSGVTLAVGISLYGAGNLGPFWDKIAFGLARTIFSFALGVGLQRLQKKLAIPRRETCKGWLPPIALTILLTQVPGGRAWDMACIFLLLPALLWLGTVWEVPQAWPFRLLGEISFPLYCIHGPLTQAVFGVGRPPAYVWILMIVAAWWLSSRVDRPLRKWLLQRWSFRPTSTGPALPGHSPASLSRT